eukprot:maker-scaffold260_size234135-snap-gene-1.14 protein:Tk09537 transcript:maker-scaffold260_size234135-snap-gene-1.14-mRNA-1 annotation:"empty spiracles"
MTLATETMSVIPSSVVKTSKSLGFSIDSIVGAKTANFNHESTLRETLAVTPTDLRIKDRCPISTESKVHHHHRPFSPEDHNGNERRSRSRSRSPLIDPDRRSPPSPQSSTSAHRLSNSGSPPVSPSLVRPIPSMAPGLRDLPNLSGFPPLPQSYIDQLANLKAIYERNGEMKSSQGGMTPTSIPSSMSHGHPLHPALSNALGPAGLMGLHRPPSLPPMFLGGGGGGPSPMGQHIPREYPLYPWFLSRNRFPGGPHLPEFLLPFRKPKRIRTAFSPSQLLKLEQAFEKNQYVVGAERKELAKHLNLSETQVKVWFQNRRTKHKREQQEQEQMQHSSKSGGGGSSSSERGSSSNVSNGGSADAGGGGSAGGALGFRGSSSASQLSAGDFSLTHYEDDDGISEDEEIDCDS